MHSRCVSVCLRSTDISLEKERKTGKRKEANRRENGNVALTVVSIIRRKTYATIQEKIFHVLAKQQQTNDKRVCR